MKFILKILIFLVLSAAIIGCSQSMVESPEPRELVNPTPTSIQTSTHTPHPTAAIEPSLTSSPIPPNTPSPPGEVIIHEIPLVGPIVNPKSQISGMAWYGDKLIILPQYPEKKPAENNHPALFALEKNDILTYLDGKTPGPLTPTMISFLGSNLITQIPGYEGYEAIAVDGDRVYLTIEANDRGRMAGYLVEGTYLPNQEVIQIDSSSLRELPLPVQIFNYAYESLIITENKSLAIYEANGVELNPRPFALRIDNLTNVIEELEISHIEYRLTDATETDENGRFWVTNIFMPIEFWLYTESDPIFEKFGRGETHSKGLNVERLLELQYNGDQISITETKPILLELDNELNARNWEALVTLDDMGFLAMTDTYPDTILAFIPFPE